MTELKIRETDAESVPQMGDDYLEKNGLYNWMGSIDECIIVSIHIGKRVLLFFFLI